MSINVFIAYMLILCCSELTTIAIVLYRYHKYNNGAVQYFKIMVVSFAVPQLLAVYGMLNGESILTIIAMTYSWIKLKWESINL